MIKSKPYGSRMDFTYSYGNTIKNVGCCCLHTYTGDNTIRLYSVRITEKYQGRGYGKRMIAQLIAWVKRHRPEGITRIWLDTSNPIALHVYEKCGFKIIKNECNYTKWEMEYKL